MRKKKKRKISAASNCFNGHDDLLFCRWLLLSFFFSLSPPFALALRNIVLTLSTLKLAGMEEKGRRQRGAMMGSKTCRTTTDGRYRKLACSLTACLSRLSLPLSHPSSTEQKTKHHDRAANAVRAVREKERLAARKARTATTES